MNKPSIIKRLSCCVAMMLLPACLMAEDYIYMQVTTDCCIDNIPRTEVRKLTFEAGNLVVTKADGSDVNFGLSVLKSIAFTSKADAVTALGHADTDLNLQGNLIVANGAGILLIYDALGRVVRQESVSSSRSELNISGLSRGMYIARLGNRTLKFVR